MQIILHPESVRAIGVNVASAGVLGFILHNGRPMISAAAILGGLWLIRQGTAGELKLNTEMLIQAQRVKRAPMVIDADAVNA